MATEAFVSNQINSSSIIKGVPTTVNYTLQSGTHFTYNFDLNTIKQIYGNDIKMADVMLYVSSYDNYRGSGGAESYIKENGIIIATYWSRGQWNESINTQLVTVYPGKSYQAYSQLCRGYSTQVRIVHIYK